MKPFSLIVLLWYVFPIVLFFACNYVVSALSLAEKYKIKAPDIATPFLLIGLHELSKLMFQESIVPFAILAILLMGIIIAIFHAYYFGEIQYKRFFKMFWRIIFLFICTLYIFLIGLSIFQHVS